MLISVTWLSQQGVSCKWYNHQDWERLTDRNLIGTLWGGSVTAGQSRNVEPEISPLLAITKSDRSWSSDGPAPALVPHISHYLLQVDIDKWTSEPIGSRKSECWELKEEHLLLWISSVSIAVCFSDWENVRRICQNSKYSTLGIHFLPPLNCII